MVRLATAGDVAQLDILNREFNGNSETTLGHMKASLLNNRQEVVIVADDNGLLAGFVCIQLKKSFCYEEYMPEITEVYVRQEYRKKGIATAMLNFAEEYCSKKYSCYKIELLTGKNNFVAQSVYDKLGYTNDGEIHLSKKTTNTR